MEIVYNVHARVLFYADNHLTLKGNKMKTLMFGAALVAAVLLTGCAQVGGPSTSTALGFGGIIIDHKAPAAFDIDNNVSCAKCGKASSKSIVVFTTGDSSIKAAMDAGGITKVNHVDYEVKNIFNVYSEATTIVYGE